MYSYFYGRNADWGGPGGSITVGIVGNVPAIPLPRPDVVSPSRVVDESKGLFKSEPAPQPKPAPDATPIPKFERNKPPKYVTRPSKLLENPTPPPQNAIPYGGGGTPTVPTASFALGAGTTQAGLGFTGAAGGDFGSRFSWYVEAVQRRVSSNWLQSTVDPSVTTAPKVIVTFTILRNGSVTNIQVTQSSNNNSVDSSATARGARFQSARAAASGILGIERECGILVRFSSVRELATESPRHREDGINYQYLRRSK